MCNVILAQSVKGSQSQDGVGELSGVKRSYTQELLDFGISFGTPNLRRNPTNPFITGKKQKQNTALFSSLVDYKLALMSK